MTELELFVDTETVKARKRRLFGQVAHKTALGRAALEERGQDLYDGENPFRESYELLESERDGVLAEDVNLDSILDSYSCLAEAYDSIDEDGIEIAGYDSWSQAIEEADKLHWGFRELEEAYLSSMILNDQV